MRVLVRVRGTARDGDRVLTTEGARGEHIILSDGTASRAKTYTFDRVLSAEADQNMVYTDAIGSVLDDVMLGYHCTIFAYGQTGTGKTHTMEGDLASYMETYAPEAGIIPRALYRLFHVLESRGDDFAVRMSFVELYNEELRDLLNEQNAPLRMYDDPRGRGVRLQGLEEVPLTSAAHGLALLRQGSERRHVASTLCNHASSRSHCVFTLTVQVRDAKGSSGAGEQYMRIGKLNLVDLAGSESIGRSGAENGRAREAGVINQSLLALGRVINALVDGSSHVPYRESRLTRLLQDSLGGRAKTCIIATVSDDRANLDETLSTLDYASRAKSIKNRPEAMQRMTRAALLREYVGEIDRLKNDLAATRAQNGIYVSETSWAHMESERNDVKKQLDELKRNAEVSASRLLSMQEQLEQNTRVLARREVDAKRAEAELDGVREEAQHRVASLEAQLTQHNESSAQMRAALAHMAAQVSDARLAMHSCARVDLRTSLSTLVRNVETHVQGLQRNLRDSLASMPQLDAPDAESLQERIGQVISLHMNAVYAEHEQTAKRAEDALQVYTKNVANVMETSDALVQAWDEGLSKTAEANTALAHHAETCIDSAQKHAKQFSHAWSEARRNVHDEAATLRETIFSAVDAFVRKHDERLAHGMQDAQQAEHGVAQNRASLLRAVETQAAAANAAKETHASAAEHVALSSEAARTSEQVLSAQWHAHDDAVSMAAHSACMNATGSAHDVAEPMASYMRKAHAAAKSAAGAVHVAHDSLHALDVRAMASVVQEDAQSMHAALASATQSLESSTPAPQAAPSKTPFRPPPLTERTNATPFVTPSKRRS